MERLFIAFESLDFYRALVIGGVYEFSSPMNTSSILTYVPALRHCIDNHPHLSIITGGAETESPYYQVCPCLDLTQHIQIFDLGDAKGNISELQAIEWILPRILDAKWTVCIPAWKITIIPFSETRSFIAFSFSHALGDGISGIAFHRSFLNGLQQEPLKEEEGAEMILVHIPKKISLNPPLDAAENLPVTWSYLLAPLLATVLPRVLGFRSHIDPITPKTWTGSAVSYSPETSETGVRTLSIDSATVDKALNVCRAHGAKLTGLIHQFIVIALSEHLPDRHKFDNFVARTPINLRHLVNLSNDHMGIYVSSLILILEAPHKGPKRTDFSWDLSKLITEKLAAAAKSSQNHPVGLLRYLNGIRAWTQSKIGQRRCASYEVSNLLTFKPQSAPDAAVPSRCSVVEMMFAQPTEVAGPSLIFNIVSVVNGPLTIAVNWQVGSLDLEPKLNEAIFIGNVCESIRRSFAELS
jgi:hypothetical protein